MINRFGRPLWSLFLGFFFCYTAQAQTPIQVLSGADLPAATEWLLLSDTELRDQVVPTEAVLDLVEAWMADSIVEVRRQRLLGFGGWLAQKLGSRYWEILDSTKRKYVGTNSRAFKIYDGISAEYDINIFLMPHLPAYVAMAQTAFAAARQRGRSDRPFRFDRPDYECPEELKFEDRGYLTIECEGTPVEGYRDALAEVFLPMAEGYHGLDSHPNFGARYPAVGMYGTWCMDCNHNCRPEIHPMEWLWWLDLSTDRPGGPQAKSWMLGAMRDGSRRLEDWSPGPLAGVLSIPVALPAGTRKLEVLMEHLVFDGFSAEALADLKLPAEAVAAKVGTQQYALQPEGRAPIEVTVKFTGKDPGAGMRIWWSDFKQDGKSGNILGYLHLGTAVENIYAGRLTVDYR